MSSNKKSIAETVSELIEPSITELGCKLWDIEFVKEGARKILRITIDSENGIDINLCEAVHRAIDPILDEADPIPEAYYLEVSSPGVERELRLPFHYIVSIGEKVDVKLFTAINGNKHITGILTEYNGETKTVTVDGIIIPTEKISRANIHFDFN